jgi:signal transduction histidine kinase/ligand-binding sensor domain-containing protein
MPHAKISDLTRTDDGRPLIAVNGAGLKQFADGKVEPYPIRSANKQNALLADRDADSNKLLRDRDGGLWIGTVARGLIHVHQGRTDVFTKADGLSSNIVLCLFEDREGTIWVATTAGVDRFRELAVTTISVKEGLSSDATSSVAAAKDGSVWIATYNDLTRWNNGQFTIYGKASGLPDDVLRSLYEDDRGRIWVSSPRGLSYLMDGRFVTAAAIPSPEVGSITGDKAGNLWVSGNQGLSHLLDGRLVEHFPWSILGRQQQASVVLFDPEQGGLWLSFWQDGGVEYFKDGQVRASYTVKDGLGQGPVPHLRLDREGTLWAATEGGGLSRIKNGHIATLTTRNGLPCDAIHWSMEDDDRSLWLYTACGVVRITRSELDAWIADTNHRVETTVWDAADGVRLRSVAAGAFGPLVTKSADGKLWFFTGEGVQVIDPHHLPDNKLPPPVHIENIVADHKTYWQNLPGAARSSVRLPALTRDLQIDFTALSMVAPEKVHFKYKLQGQDSDWREVVNDREVQYSNLPPASYQFRVIASNNSGFWNEQGDTVEFTIAPAFYQTNWFRALCAAAFLLLLWAAYQLRVRRLHREFALTLGARVGERTSIARDLHDTLLQSFHGLLVRFQIVSDLLPERPVEAKQHLDKAIDRAATAITEARDAVQGLRESTVEMNDLAQAVNSLAEELAADSANQNSPRQDSPMFRLTVEGESRDLHPILRDEIYRIAGESMRNAFCHAHARQIEVEIRYDDEQFRLRVRDDGKGFDRAVLSVEERPGHFGLAGMRERAKLIGGKLTVWSDVDEGTEVELRVPGAIVYTNSRRGSWLSQIFAGKP